MCKSGIKIKEETKKNGEYLISKYATENVNLMYLWMKKKGIFCLFVCSVI